MIRFEFNERKATQAAALFLQKNGGRMNYMKLIKLLYLTDRESLNLWERPLTGDSYYSMEHGPILSKILDFISHGFKPGRETYWHKKISNPRDYEIFTIAEPDYDELSKREIDLIDRIYEQYKEYDQYQMVDICHAILSEWEDPGRTSIPIRIDDILDALDKTEIERDAMEDMVLNQQFAKKILSA